MDAPYLQQQYGTEVNDVPVCWDLEKGKFAFFGIDASIFWLNSSLSHLLLPIVDEVGIELFRLMVADSASQGAQEQYATLASSFATDFTENFLAWAELINTAGWGKVHLLEYKPEENHAIVQVDNPWELSIQKQLPCEQRWGCPFLLGQLQGIFKHALPQHCWASDHCEYLDNGEARVRFTLYPSEQTLQEQLQQLRKDKQSLHEQALKDEIQQQNSQLQTSNNLLENIANLDFLTNLNNRRSLENKLAQIKEEGLWDAHSLMFIDLDQFKVINDTCGHLAGDRLLTIVGERLITTIGRDKHFIYRYGGDEFTIVLNLADTSLAVSLANSVRKAINHIHFEWSEKVYQISCSIGLIPLKTIEAEFDSAIIAADNACYQAKRNGRNQIYLSEKVNEHVEHQLYEMNWVHKIRDAIKNDRFELHFQPIKPLRHRGKIALEALIRMVGDHGEMIMPSQFLPAAENYEVIFEIDCWVINNILKSVQKLKQHYDKIEYIAINLSGNTISNPKLEGFISACFEKYQIDPAKICFEVTETHMMMNLDNAKILLEKLRKHGCTISLDDFGAGMSSFGYLKDLPVDKIKIDGGFVKTMHESLVDYTFVESIANVARAMGIKTVAEFVENERIVELLTDIRVDYVQGFHIGKPQPWATTFPHD